MKQKPLMTKSLIENVGGVTLVGYFTKEFPTERGNCFDGKVKDAMKYVKILNMNYENLSHLLRTGVVSWPIQIQIFDDSHYAIIDDERIPKNYLSKDHCPICTPERLQSKEWRDNMAKRIRGGEVQRSIIRFADGRKGYMDRVEFKARPMPLNQRYTLIGENDGLSGS